MDEKTEMWIRKVKAWADLIRVRANYPNHPLHMSTYKPLYEWLIDNQPEHLGFPLEEK